MNLHADQILKRLEKPLSLAGKLIPDSLMARYFGSSKGSGEHPYKPSPSTHSTITSNPLIPTFFLLMVIMLLLSSSPVQLWLTSPESLPSLAQLFALSQKKQPAALPKAGENVSVWTKMQSGFYYCEGGVLFGSQPGELMAQGDALMSGYRPAEGRYCTDGNPREASRGSVPFRVEQWLRYATHNLPDAADFYAQIQKKQSGMPKASEGVSVWTKKQSGFYYCQGDILFGSKPGELMKQSDALMSGYRPATLKYCDTGKRAEASIGSLPLPTSSGVK